MRRSLIPSILLCAALCVGVLGVVGCSDEAPLAPPSGVNPAVIPGQADGDGNVGPAMPMMHRNYVAVLSGEDNGVETRARGVAKFHLNDDGTLRYKLIVANIENVFMSHIHIAPRGSNGPIGVWLYPSAPPDVLIPGRFNGVLAEGTITDADILAPAGTTVADLMMKIRMGMAYVNVHTEQNRPGEIRGQIDIPRGMVE